VVAQAISRSPDPFPPSGIGEQGLVGRDALELVQAR
jgi:hypothetical protein